MLLVLTLREFANPALDFFYIYPHQEGWEHSKTKGLIDKFFTLKKKVPEAYFFQNDLKLKCTIQEQN